MDSMNVTLRVDRNVKQEADKLFASLGLSFSAAVNMFLQKAIRSKSIPFEVSLQTKEEADRAALTAALKTLLASQEAQARIGSIHKGSDSTIEAILPGDDLDKYL